LHLFEKNAKINAFAKNFRTCDFQHSNPEFSSHTTSNAATLLHLWRNFIQKEPILSSLLQKG